MQYFLHLKAKLEQKLKSFAGKYRTIKLESLVLIRFSTHSTSFWIKIL